MSIGGEGEGGASSNILIEKFASRFVNKVDTAGQSTDQDALSVTGQTDTRHRRWIQHHIHTRTPTDDKRVCRARREARQLIAAPA